MATYLCIKNGETIKSCSVRSSAEKPYLCVGTGYLPLTTNTVPEGFRVKSILGTETTSSTYTTTTAVDQFFTITETKTKIYPVYSVYRISDTYTTSIEETITTETSYATRESTSSTTYGTRSSTSQTGYLTRSSTSTTGYLTRASTSTTGYLTRASTSATTYATRASTSATVKSYYSAGNPFKAVYTFTNFTKNGAVNLTIRMTGAGDPAISLIRSLYGYNSSTVYTGNYSHTFSSSTSSKTYGQYMFKGPSSRPVGYIIGWREGGVTHSMLSGAGSQYAGSWNGYKLVASVTFANYVSNVYQTRASTSATGYQTRASTYATGYKTRASTYSTTYGTRASTYSTTYGTRASTSNTTYGTCSSTSETGYLTRSSTSETIYLTTTTTRQVTSE